MPIGRTNPLTDIALEAVQEMEQVLNEVIAEWSVPLGMEVVPDSTRRGRMKRNSEDIATLLVQLSQQFGPEEVQQVLGLDPGDGQTMFEHMVNQYGEETVARAMALAHLRLQQDMGTPDAERYLPA